MKRWFHALDLKNRKCFGFCVVGKIITDHPDRRFIGITATDYLPYLKYCIVAEIK